MIYLFILIFLYAVYPIYLRVGMTRLNRAQKAQLSLSSVSIIISAKNEERYIASCLNALVAQNYPKNLLEIIVADDGSTDQTASIVQGFAKRYFFVKLIHSFKDKEFQSSKKSALAAGLRRASGEFIFFTDADCQPPTDWLQNMLTHFKDRTGLVAGFSPQKSNSLLWSNVLIADSLAAACVAAGSIGWQRGVTCTGRNLAVRRAALQDIGYYNNFPDSLSGDDDFLLQLVARHPDWRVAYSTSPESVVPASGSSSFRSFMRQKQRHLSAGHYFPSKIKFAYGLFHTVNFLIWLCALAGVFFSWIFILPLLIKLLFDFSLLKYWSGLLNIKVKIMPFLLWDGLFLIVHLCAAPVSFWGTVKWTSGR